MTAVVDGFGRPLGSLRLSVTDRCNMRCRYCMPEEDYLWLPRSSLLTFEELARLASLFQGLGVRKIRITGGEPLLRHGLPNLVRMLAGHPQTDDLALTTNGILLEANLPALIDAGLDRVTVSLDTLQAERQVVFARSTRHSDALRGIEAARTAGLPVKLNSVMVRGFNDDELLDLLEFGRTTGSEVRFIEYMDVGGATRWSEAQVLSQDDMLAMVAARYGSIEPVSRIDDPTAPAERFRLPDGTIFGIIASVTKPFCRTCDRSRITADGTWYLCLYGDEGVSLRDSLRMGMSDAEIAQLIRTTWESRRDRGAEVRRATPGRGVLHQLTSLRADPRREMHTRGG